MYHVLRNTVILIINCLTVFIFYNYYRILIVVITKRPINNLRMKPRFNLTLKFSPLEFVGFQYPAPTHASHDYMSTLDYSLKSIDKLIVPCFQLVELAVPPVLDENISKNLTLQYNCYDELFVI